MNYATGMHGSLGLEVCSTGWDWRHPADWRMVRQDGAGEWVFVQSVGVGRWYGPDRSDVMVPGTCLFYPPDGFQAYGAADRVFSNHWFHATGSVLAEALSRCGLPLAQPIPLTDPTRVSQALFRLHQEFTRRESGWEVGAVGAVLTVLTEAGRARQLPSQTRRSDDGPLHTLRERLHQHPGEPWPVERMARLVGLSPSRFNDRYRAAFSTSPTTDVINARLALARRLLEGGSTVARAAASSGFCDVAYFHRQFRRRLGFTPGACRRHASQDR